MPRKQLSTWAKSGFCQFGVLSKNHHESLASWRSLHPLGGQSPVGDAPVPVSLSRGPNEFPQWRAAGCLELSAAVPPLPLVACNGRVSQRAARDDPIPKTRLCVMRVRVHANSWHALTNGFAWLHFHQSIRPRPMFRSKHPNKLEGRAMCTLSHSNGAPRPPICS